MLKKTTLIQAVTLLVTLGYISVARAEENQTESEKEKKGTEAAPSVEAKVNPKVGEPQDEESEKPGKKTGAGLAKLIKKLTDQKGNSVPIGILSPLDYTTQNFAEACQETILSSLGRYGKFDIRNVTYSPAALTLEEFRKVVVENDVDVVILAVLKPTNFDVFLYDRRTPYNIYAHSETLPEEVQYQITKNVVEEYTKVIVRRALYAYMQDQFFELPREEIRPFLNAEIPRWIASSRSLNTINREILSNFYLSAGVGGALSSGNGQMWNSNLVNVEAAYRVTKNWYVEAFMDLFSLNTIGLSGKYMFSSKESPFRFTVGAGLATAVSQKTLAWDQNHTQGLGGTYLVPSASFIFPIVEVHAKVETKLFVGGSKFVLAVIPGIFFMF